MIIGVNQYTRCGLILGGCKVATVAFFLVRSYGSEMLLWKVYCSVDGFMACCWHVDCVNWVAVIALCLNNINVLHYIIEYCIVLPGSSVGIATGYGLDGPGIESRWGGEIFRTCPERPWGPPSLLYNGYRFFPGGKERPRSDPDHSPSSAVVTKE